MAGPLRGATDDESYAPRRSRARFGVAKVEPLGSVYNVVILLLYHTRFLAVCLVRHTHGRFSTLYKEVRRRRWMEL